MIAPMNTGSTAVMSDADEEKANAGEMAVGVIIGRTSEFFDFFVYAIASVLVFPQLVFPFVSALTGTLYSFAIFALAFVVRPLGTVIFLRVERLYGRGTKLAITLLLLGSSTVAIGFVPGYAQVGSIAIAVLIVLRIGQGLAFGGSWDGRRSTVAGMQCCLSLARRWASLSRAHCSRPSSSASRRRISAAGVGAIRSSSPSPSTWWRCSRGCASSWRPNTKNCSR
jgi:MFS family permease